MEELLIFFFQFFIEVVLQVLLELPWDIFIGERESSGEQSFNKWQWAFASLICGALAAAAVMWFHPDTYIKSSGVRIAYLFLAPPVSALFSRMIARRFARKGRVWVEPNLHALCAFCFSLALTVLRFTYAHRPTL